MTKELELWQFMATRLARGENVMLLVVAESSGSSPGRAGYKMAVGSDGELCGSIGGGVMEVNLVEKSRDLLGTRPSSNALSRSDDAFLSQQIHQRNSPNASGMICSGKQTVIFKVLTPSDLNNVRKVIDSPDGNIVLTISPDQFSVGPSGGGPQNTFEKLSETDFRYIEWLGYQNALIIIGGGHCALALSELMSKLDFRITIVDDRPELNTIEKNEFANDIRFVKRYEDIADHIDADPNTYLVVMTLGYTSDKVVIEKLLDKEFIYFGVLGSKAKMATLMRELRHEGHDNAKLRRIRTPIGLPINSHTPEEIAVSIAAEIISVKNAQNAGSALP